MKWLIPRIFGFNARFPDIEVRLRSSGPLDDLERTRCDLNIAE